MSYREHTEVAGLDWTAGRLLPAFQVPQRLMVYDIRQASPAARLTITTMTGILNRPQPRVYLITGDDDIFWLQQGLQTVPHEHAVVANDDVIKSLLSSYRTAVQGLIIYDPALSDTINVATMLAGQRDGIVVAPEQAQDLQQAYQLPILADLRSYGWRMRLQAYDWARHHLLDNSSARLVAGLNPAIMDHLRSFLVATRTFIYWLDSRQWLPHLSDGLLSERSLMQQILCSFAPGAVHLGWFIDEGSGVNLTSRAAIPVLASDLFTNLEVWTAVQPQMVAASRGTDSSLRRIASRGEAAQPGSVYVSFTISDGDNLQYNQHRMLRLWRESLRGSFPIGWTISPALQQAAPALAAYYTSTATPNDEFIAGPSGAGYMFPSSWPAEQIEPFLQLTGQLMQSMQLSLLGVLDTNLLQSIGISFAGSFTSMNFTDAKRQQEYIQALAPHGLRGILNGAGVDDNSWTVLGGIPIYRNLGLADNAAKIVSLVTHAAQRHTRRSLFLNVYLLAWTITLVEIKKAIEQLGSSYSVVLPGQLLTMLTEKAA
jgi:hypothetical protein